MFSLTVHWFELYELCYMLYRRVALDRLRVRSNIIMAARWRAMLVAGHSFFTAVVYIFFLLFTPTKSPRSLERSPPLQTLPHVRWWPRFINFGQKFGWPGPLPLRNLAVQRRQNFGAILHNFASLDREYLRNATRNREWENGVANTDTTTNFWSFFGPYLLTYLLPQRTAGKLISVYFGP